MRDKLSNQRFLRRRYWSGGFSLIELMIALLISLLIIAAVGYIYVGNRNAFRTQTADSRLTDNARIAIEYLTRDLRQASRLGCTRFKPDPDNKFGTTLITASAPFMAAQNLADIQAMSIPTSGAPVLRLQPELVIQSFDDGAMFNGPALPATSPRRPNTDILQIMKSGDNSSQLAVSMDTSAPNVLLRSLIPGANPTAPNQLFVISDCKTTEIFRASVNPNASAPGGSMSLANPAWNVGGRLSEIYGVEATVSRFEPVIYMIQNPSVNADVQTPRLVRIDLGTDGAWNGANPQRIIADGIEDFQIRFGVANAGLAANAPDSYMRATDINAAGAETWRNVRSAEITLTVISERDRVATTATSRVNEANATTDTRLRQRIVQVVHLRNGQQ